MKTADRRNRILLIYVALILGLFAYERFNRSAIITALLKSRPHAPHEPAGTIANRN